MKCNKENCPNNATHQLVFKLAVNDKHPPAISTPLIYLCSDHKDDFTKADFFDDQEQWGKLCAQFIKAGKMAPTKKHSDILIQLIPQLN